MALAVVSNWVNNFIIGLITPVLVKETNGYGAFYFFAAFAALSFVFVWILVPETKGVSLEGESRQNRVLSLKLMETDMDSLFHSSTGAEDERRRLRHLAGILRVQGSPSPNSEEGKGGKVETTERIEMSTSATGARRESASL